MDSMKYNDFVIDADFRRVCDRTKEYAYLDEAIRYYKSNGCACTCVYRNDTGCRIIWVQCLGSAGYKRVRGLSPLKMGLDKLGYKFLSWSYNSGKERDPLDLHIFVAEIFNPIFIWVSVENPFKLCCSVTPVPDPDIVCLSLLCRNTDFKSVEVYLAALVCKLMGYRSKYTGGNIGSEYAETLYKLVGTCKTKKFLSEYEQKYLDNIACRGSLFTLELNDFLEYIKDVWTNSTVDALLDLQKPKYDTEYIEWFWKESPEAAKDAVYSLMRELTESTYIKLQKQ